MRSVKVKAPLALFGSLLLPAALLLPACGDDGASDDASSGTDTSAETTSATTTGASTTDATTTDATTTDATTTDTSTTDPTTTTTTGDGDGDCGASSSFMTGPAAPSDFVVQLTVGAPLSCDNPLTITAVGGEISSVSDGAGGCNVTIESITFQDVPPTACGGAMLSITGLILAGSGTGTDTTSPAGGGTILGTQPIVINGTVSGTGIPIVGDLAPTELADFGGSLPGGGTVTYGANDITMAYANTNHQLAMASPMVSIITVDITLTGLTGSLTLTP